MNVYVGHIAWRQASMGGYASKASLPPPPPVAFASEDEDDDDGDNDDASDDNDGGASSINEMYLTLSPFVTCDKNGE